MAQTVVGIFDNAVNSEKAVDRLLSSGYARENIDIADHTRDGYTDADRDRDNEGIGGFFSSLFGDSDDTKHHTTTARNGIVVTVHTKTMEEAERAADILDDFGTVDVNERAGVQRDATTTRATDVDADNTIEVVEEDLKVGKREVETGGVRVRSRIVERPVEEHVRLRSEHVNVERKPVDRPATEADMAKLKDGETIEMTEHAESVVASKEARVTEEIHVDKDVEEHEEVVQDTVRSTEVDVEETAPERRDALDTDVDRDRERRV